ncbi:DNA-binding protein [Streptomyces sp. rh34]|uniref:DNA-binding protein n=1 Tax=Streptomyces sp. rh34 TaxID=2034272 RepID=UPI000BF1BC2C|nr:DNA-binding protein [Streptomyces sp. rh34]
MAGKQALVDDVLSSTEVCKQYPLFRNPQALAELRWRGTGPDYIKTAPGRAGRVFYRRSAIEKWLDERTVSGGAAA